MNLGFNFGPNTFSFSTTTTTKFSPSFIFTTPISHPQTNSSGKSLSSLFPCQTPLLNLVLFFIYMQVEKVYFVCKTLIIIFTQHLLLLLSWLHNREFHNLTLTFIQIFNPIVLVFWRFQIFIQSTGSNQEIQLAMWVPISITNFTLQNLYYENSRIKLNHFEISFILGIKLFETYNFRD